jgi:sugar-phosphatase
MKQLDCDAVLFDLDGVLIDSTSCIERHWAAWARRHGLDLTTVMQAAHGVRTIETMRLVAPHLDVEAEAARFTACEAADTDDVVVIEGAARLLSCLPHDAWAVVTSGSEGLARARLARGGLPAPKTLVTADDVRLGKPAPEPYLVGAERLGIPVARCVVVEDAPAGIEAARAAGMRVIGVASTHAPKALMGTVAVTSQLSDLSIAANEGDGSRLTIRIA